jgi:hypothetical protein
VNVKPYQLYHQGQKYQSCGNVKEKVINKTSKNFVFEKKLKSDEKYDDTLIEGN